MSNRKNALFFVPMIPRFVTDFNNVAEFLVQSGFSVSIYAPAADDRATTGWTSAPVIEEYRKMLPKRMKFETLPVPYLRGQGGSLASVLKTIWISYRAGKRDPDCLAVTWTSALNLLCGLPLRFLNVRTVVLQTGLGRLFEPNKLSARLALMFVKPLYKYLFSGKNSRVIVHNTEDKQFFVTELGISADKIQVTPGCGVDPRRFPFFSQLPRRTKKIILVPVRLIVEKGIFEAAEASQILRKKGIEHEMWFTSGIDKDDPSSPRESDLETLQRQNDWVKFIGYQPSLVPLYETCDLVCVPTRYPEGLPTALIEASACGRPIVTTDNVGCREIIEQGKNGLLVSPGSAEELAEALEALIKDDELAERLRQNAYQKFLRGFTKDVMLAKTVEVFKSLGLEVEFSLSRAN